TRKIEEFNHDFKRHVFLHINYAGSVTPHSRSYHPKGGFKGLCIPPIGKSFHLGGSMVICPPLSSYRQRPRGAATFLPYMEFQLSVFRHIMGKKILTVLWDIFVPPLQE